MSLSEEFAEVMNLMNEMEDCFNKARNATTEEEETKYFARGMAILEDDMSEEDIIKKMQEEKKDSIQLIT